MRCLVLGPLEVMNAAGPISLGGPKQRVVLANLAVRANAVVSAETLIDQLWGDEPPESAKNTLQTYISHLRKALGPERIEGRPPGYVLHLAPHELDATQFERLLGEARAADGQPARVATILREALALWRGSAFADLAVEGSLAGEIARLEELRLGAIEERISADLASGRHADLIGELEGLTREHPLRERLWAHLMLALYRSGRQADALAAFGRARELLAEELGVDPSPELQRLQERILKQDPDLEVTGEPLRGYRLLEKIGEGAFGLVYRAVQPQVGREVAVKSIHPELANQPDFVRRFEREAQLVARLEHPHVVPLYDYWRDPDGAYLVMRFLRGGSLEDLLGHGPLPPDRAAAILDQVAGALAAAHRQGVVHRDVKPGNVLLDEDGNAYLTDFGVALDAGAPEQTTGAMVRGTPAYLSPEQIRLQPATARSDIYALGVVLYEMLTAEHPFPESSLRALLDQHMHEPLPSARRLRPEIPPAVDSVIARATAKDAGKRFGDALDLAAAFRGAIQGSGESLGPAEDLRNPYKGLRAFLEADAGDFFGREVVTRRLIERLAEPGASARFLCVVGPSGSGKSSVVKAGLVPALRRGAIAGSESWYVVEMLPGPHPLRELDTALLAVATSQQPSLVEELERDELGLLRAVDRVLPDPSAELVIVVDQLEEVFTLVDDPVERARFLDAIASAATHPMSRVRVVSTLRADFFDQPLNVRGFGDLLAARNEAITPMSPEDLERAIAGPAQRVGLRVEPGLVAAMVADVVDRPGALPLLQYALTELAERDEVSSLSLETYRAIGGASGALARRAERIYGAMNEGAREACRQLFLRLVTLGEGTEDTRRRVRRSEIPALDGAMDGVIESFGRHRLLSFDRDALSREPTVEIAHEALLHRWPRLRGWLEEDAETRAVQAHLIAAARQWDTGGRDDAELYRAARLVAALDFSSRYGQHLNELEQSFVARSREASDRETRRIRRTNRRLRGLLGAVAIFLVVALIAAGIALVQGGHARRSATVALSESLGAQAVAETQLDTALLLAEEGVNMDDSQRTESDLLAVLLHSPSAIHVLHVGGVGAPPEDIVVSPDGGTLAVLTRDRTLRFYDTSTRQPTGKPVHDVPAYNTRRPAFTPDGSGLWVLRGAGLQKIDVRTGRVESTIRLHQDVENVYSPVLLSRDGRVVYLQMEGWEHVAAWDTSTGRRLAEVDVPGLSLLALAFARETGEVVALTTRDGGRIQVRDGRTLALERSFHVPLPAPQQYQLAVAPDGHMAAYTMFNPGFDQSIRFVDLRTGQIRVGAGAQAGEGQVAFSPDGGTAVSVTNDGLNISVWDVASATLLQTLSGHAGEIFMLAFDPSGRSLYSAADDGNVFVWDLSGRRSFGRSFTASLGSFGGPNVGWHFPYFSSSPDGKSIAVAHATEIDPANGVSKGGNVSIVDLSTGRVTTEVRVAGRVPGIDSVIYAEFSPDGTELLVTPGPSSNGDITLWRLDGRTARLIRTFSGLSATPVPDDGGFWNAPWATFSPDGKWIAGLDRREDGTSRLIEWDAATGSERVAPLDLRWKSTDGFLDGINQNVVYSPDGSLIATSALGDRTVIIDARTLKPVRTLPDPRGVAFVAFSPTNSNLLAEGSSNVGIVRLWDVSTGKQVAEVPASNPGLWSVQFAPTGSMLLTDSSDGVARLWSVPDLRQIGTDLPGLLSVPGTATFAGRGNSTTAVLVYATGQAFAYPASPSAWERQACLVAGRNFTKAEWARYVGDRPYEQVCPQYPSGS
ncbi:MAG: protein kinase domain-containing protein [Actinomycetota bacterium]